MKLAHGISCNGNKKQKGNASTQLKATRRPTLIGHLSNAHTFISDICSNFVKMRLLLNPSHRTVMLKV